MKSLFSSLLVVAFLCITVIGCSPATDTSTGGGAAPPAATEGDEATDDAGGSDAKPAEDEAPAAE
jgi:hypothetical protein